MIPKPMQLKPLPARPMVAPKQFCDCLTCWKPIMEGELIWALYGGAGRQCMTCFDIQPRQDGYLTLAGLDLGPVTDF